MVALKKRTGLLAVALLLFLGGCGMSYDVQENTIFVKKDGSVAETNVMSLSGVGSAEELEAFIDEELAAYDGDGKVEKESFSVDGDTASLTVTYSDGNTYADFVRHDFFVGSVVRAQAAGYPFDVQFYEAGGSDSTEAGGELSVPRDTVLEDPNLAVVILAVDTNVEVGGTILYYSENVTPTGKSTCTVSGYEEEGIEKAPAYIIFR